MSLSSNNKGNLWWNRDLDDSEIYKDIFEWVNFVNEEQDYRHLENEKYAKLYGNKSIFQSSRFAGVDSFTTSSTLSHRVTLNIIQALSDTVTSKITKNKPRPSFLTNRGNWTQQQKAKNLTKFIDGVFHSTKLYQASAKAFLDSVIFGTGALKLFTDNNEIKVERVLIDELIVDEIEAIHGKPKQLHQIKFISRQLLMEKFPEHAGSIINANTSNLSRHLVPDRFRKRDMILVVESWHLATTPNSSDGRHVISIENATLMAEEYTKKDFPFVFFRWNERPVGFYGQGLAEQLQGIQLEINKLLRTIQISMNLVSIPKLFIEASSKVVTSELNNKIGGVIKYAGQKPEFGSLGMIPTELFTHVDRLYQRGFEISGVSQLSAQSIKPAGLESGRALREFNDLESERFLTVSSRYEAAHLEAAQKIIEMAKEIYEDTGSFDVNVKGKGFLEKIRWEDVDLEEDKYIMQVFPTSFLSTTPSGRLQDVQELLAAGLIPAEEAPKLLDFPDVQAYNSLATAASEDIDRTIDIMVNEGKYLPPEPYQDLGLGINKMQQAYLRYRMERAPESRLELLRRWMESAKELQLRAQAEVEAEAAALEQNMANQQAEQQALDQGAIPSEAVADVINSAAQPNESGEF